MITDTQLADYCQDVYNNDETHVKQFYANRHCFAMGINDADEQILVWRGTSTASDWITDFMACYIDSEIGGVDKGFHDGPKYFCDPSNALLGPYIIKDKPLYITGHSLGAAEAIHTAAILAKRGYKNIAGVTVFACPAPGGPQIDDILTEANIPVHIYRNRLDIVPHIPVPVLFPHWPYSHPKRIINLDVAPENNFLEDSYGIFAWHRLSLYRKGVFEYESRGKQGINLLT